ncbi:MAG: hypothetical protein LIP06_14130 [Tannerellaceae bacterium]|nr:hypothetical protein [Tannerellaceae bacterium]
MVTAASTEQEGNKTNTTLKTFNYTLPVPARVTGQELDTENKQVKLRLSFQDDSFKHLSSKLIGCEIPELNYHVKNLNIQGDLPTGIIIAPSNETLVPVEIDENDILENIFITNNGIKTMQLIGLKSISHGI